MSFIVQLCTLCTCSPYAFCVITAHMVFSVLEVLCIVSHTATPVFQVCSFPIKSWQRWRCSHTNTLSHVGLVCGTAQIVTVRRMQARSAPRAAKHTHRHSTPLPWDEVSICTSKAWDEVSYLPEGHHSGHLCNLITAHSAPVFAFYVITSYQSIVVFFHQFRVLPISLLIFYEEPCQMLLENLNIWHLPDNH